jgi:tryptophanyl-tRNA synthetase
MHLQSILCSPVLNNAMRANYLEVIIYGHAKQALFELICESFKTEREKYNYYINNLPEVDALLKLVLKATAVANDVLARVREKLGFEV